ncbi:MAG: pseudouridine synthase [Leptospiraceae bacterium]|nr:pseudouridine synthase [Leptospiraceae bacterium]
MLIAFHKPFQVLSQFKRIEDKKTLKDYISIPEKPKALGRLDFDSEGLLLLSSNDSMIEKYTDPKIKIEKEYWIQVEGIPSITQLNPIRMGIQTKTAYYRGAKVEIIEDPKLGDRNPPIRFRKNIPTSWIKLILQEGQNRQVRHMTAHCGFPTLRLIRVRIGRILLADLKAGEFREVKEELLFL